MSRVGFLGPGRLGAPMVAELRAAGHEVAVLVRRPEVAEQLAGVGAVPVRSAAAAAEGAAVVVVCLFSDEQLLGLLDGEAGLLAGLEPGCVVASHVTGRRATLLATAARVRDRGGRLVDAPVSGGEAEIRAHRLTVLLGGEDAAVATAAEVLAAYASPIVRTGPLGSGLTAKLVNNLLFAAHCQAAAAAVELAGSLGVDADVLLAALAVSSAWSFAVSLLGHAGSVPELTAQVGEYLRKDVAACRAELDDVGADGRLLLDLVEQGPLQLAGGVR